MRSIFLFCLAVLFAVPQTSHAILPPDLLFSMGSQLVQFFSVGALVAAGLLSSVVYTFRHWLSLTRRHVWQIISAILVVVLITITSVSVLEYQKLQSDLLIQQQILLQKVAVLQTELQASVSQEKYEEVVTTLQTMGVDSTGATSSWSGAGTRFYSDMITLYSADQAEPFVVQLDINRREDIPGIFAQYVFLNGSVGGETFAEYAAITTTGSAVATHDFITAFDRRRSPDLLPRDSYEVELEIRGEPMKIVIAETAGDFITRDDPAYTRYHNATIAEVTYRGETFTTEAMVEGSHSENYETFIFFPGQEDLVATTYQFVLWDELGNFYMVDQSDVVTDTPAYPSHTWVLHKNAAAGTLQKSFTSDIVDESGLTRSGWRILMPEINNAIIEVSPVQTYKEETADRKRYLISGTIQDDAGERTIGGVLHYIQ